MIGIADHTKDSMLGLFSASVVGLFAGDDELADRRYHRVLVQWSEPQGDEVRYIENVNEIRFENMGRDYTIDHWGVYDAGGVLQARYKLKQARDVPAIDNAVFPPGTLRIGMP